MKLRAVLTAGVVFALGGCERGMHEMYDQPKYKPLTPTTLFADGNSSRPQVEGTVPHSTGGLEDPNPPPITAQLLTRGRERFDIYCAPCHGRAGNGDGMIARRGFPAPPGYHTDRLRDAPDSHFYQVIRDGYGVMYPYADRITPVDRWAIVTYIRALQLSQHAPVSSLDAQDQARLQGSP